MKRVVMFALSCSLLFAGDEPKLWDLDLDVLLDVRVKIASFSEESVVETPAVVSRFGRADLESMGIRPGGAKCDAERCPYGCVHHIL